MTHRNTALFSLLAATAALLAGCGGQSQEDTGTPAPETVTTTATPSSRASSDSATTRSNETAHSAAAQSETHEASVAAAAPTTEPQRPSPFTLEDTHLQTPGNSQLQIEGVRAGSHVGYDRIVVEFSGTGTPDVLAGYNPDPRQQASGNPLVPAGNAYFDLIIQGVPWTMGLDEADLAKADPSGVAAGGILEIADGGVFEANAQYVVGLDRKRPYNLYLLENPTRVVVDFAK